MDCIYLRDLTLRCLIGINPDERIHEQDVIINLALRGDFSAAGQSDDIAEALDYKSVKLAVLEHVRASRCGLLERLATEIATLCLRIAPRLKEVTVTVDKPGALRYTRSVAVEITRRR
ncbi:MAG: dihydroneopterin aldolase [Candidatus Marinimicrobia bacterium]|nr:dihydroneopterin aldolase [Candidatus Neomarinimicrobiota bacterium]